MFCISTYNHPPTFHLPLNFKSYILSSFLLLGRNTGQQPHLKEYTNKLRMCTFVRARNCRQVYRAYGSSCASVPECLRVKYQFTDEFTNVYVRASVQLQVRLSVHSRAHVHLYLRVYVYQLRPSFVCKHHDAQITDVPRSYLLGIPCFKQSNKK